MTCAPVAVAGAGFKKGASGYAKGRRPLLRDSRTHALTDSRTHDQAKPVRDSRFDLLRKRLPVSLFNDAEDGALVLIP